MAHELTVKNGKAEMFYYGQTPWHGLGTKVDHALTASEAIEAAGLNWEVRKERLLRRLKDDTYIESLAYLTVRCDTQEALGVVSKDYTIIQNHEAFSFLDSLVMSAHAKYHTAGSLRGGKRVWMLAKLPDSLVVGKEDTIDKYLLLLNGHDGRMALRVMFTPVRVVCQNTLMLALRSAQKSVMISHNTRLEKKITEARKILGLASAFFAEQQNVFNSFAQKELTENDLDSYYESIFTFKEDGDDSTEKRNWKAIEQCKKLHTEGAGHEMAEGTLWGAYNSVIEYIDHHRTSYSTNPEQYLGGIMCGEGLSIKTKAYSNALAILKN